jgi:hypothetical protein
MACLQYMYKLWKTDLVIENFTFGRLEYPILSWEVSRRAKTNSVNINKKVEERIWEAKKYRDTLTGMAGGGGGVGGGDGGRTGLRQKKLGLFI